MAQAIKDGFFMKSGVPIKKVRCIAIDVTSPLFLKEHRNKSNAKYKQHYFVKNDGNYLMAIYEGENAKGKLQRDFLILNMLETSERLKESNTGQNIDLINRYKTVGSGTNQIDLQLKAVIKKGTMVLLYKEEPEELWQLNQNEMNKRLYKVQKFDDRPWITLKYHLESRADKEIKEELAMKLNKEIQPQIAVGLKGANFLYEGVNFKISLTGKIQKI